MALADGSGPEKGVAIYEDEEQANAGVDFTQAEEKNLVRKIDIFLLPTIWLMYLLSYIDRTKYGFIPLYLATFNISGAKIHLRGLQHRQCQNCWFAA